MNSRIIKHTTAGGLLALSLLALCSCNNSELAGSWQNTKYAGPAFSRVMVLAASKQATTRRIAEDAFVAELQKRGVEGIASYTVLPGEELIDRPRLVQAVRDAKVQGVIIAKLVKVEKETQYTAPAGSYGGGGYYGSYASGFGTSYVQAGTSYQYDVVTIDARLFDVASEELVWSGSTRTFDPSNLERSARDWAKVVVDALAKRKLI